MPVYHVEIPMVVRGPEGESEKRDLMIPVSAVSAEQAARFVQETLVYLVEHGDSIRDALRKTHGHDEYY